MKKLIEGTNTYKGSAGRKGHHLHLRKGAAFQPLCRGALE